MATITLTEGNDGKAIRVRQGDEIVVGLPENASGGYRWQVARSDGLDEKKTDEREAGPRPKDPNPQVGSGGTRKFRFVAKGPASGRLELKHWREWEGDKSVIARFAVDITVTQ
jgi:inhibitor of cysteine peptidase